MGRYGPNLPVDPIGAGGPSKPSFGGYIHIPEPYPIRYRNGPFNAFGNSYSHLERDPDPHPDPRVPHPDLYTDSYGYSNRDLYALCELPRNPLPPVLHFNNQPNPDRYPPPREEPGVIQPSSRRDTRKSKNHRTHLSHAL